jgi:hypothetical protein
LFLCREKDIWGSLTEETWLCEGLAEQLAIPCQEVDELAPTGREWADLRAREADAREDAREAEEKLVALIERACVDAMESK